MRDTTEELTVNPVFCNTVLTVFRNLVMKMTADAADNPEKSMAASMMDDCLALAELGAEWITFDLLTREEAVDKLAGQLALYCFINGLDKAEAAEMISLMLERIIKMEDI